MDEKSASAEVTVVATSIQIELETFPLERDRLLSLLTSEELGWDSGRTGPNDLDREDDWRPMKP